MYIFSNIAKNYQETESTLKRKVNGFILECGDFFKKKRGIY